MYQWNGKARPVSQITGQKGNQMKAEELEIVMDAVHNALETVRCFGALKTRGAMLLIPKNDMEAYLGGNLEGKLVDAYRILEAEISGEK